jgi:hypothetical protein
VKSFDRRQYRIIDTGATRDIHSYFNLQAREEGKAVRIGRGPATVIGLKP